MNFYIASQFAEDAKVVQSLDNRSISRSKAYGDIELKPPGWSSEEFYDHMDALVNPGTRNALVVQRELVDALAEAVRVRVTSVENGEKYVAQNADEVIEMPQGHSVFETVGAWENYSTPARDLRLLIAMDTVTGFRNKVARRPQAFGVSEGPTLKALLDQLDKQLAKLMSDDRYTITYKRSDGTSPTTRTIAPS